MRVPQHDTRRPRAVLTSTGTARYEFHNVDCDFEIPEEITDFFSLSAKPGSELVRKAPGEDEITAPIMLRKLDHSFILSEVTVAGELESDWDQGGLAIFCGGISELSPTPNRPQSTWSRNRPYVYLNGPVDPQKCRWARVGLEMINGEFGVSSLVANPACGVDWSFIPLFGALSTQEALQMAMPTLRVKLERVGDDLWIWYKLPDFGVSESARRTPETLSRQWRKCREVTSFFDQAATKGGVWVGCYASRPLQAEDDDDEDELYVEFEDLEIL